MRKGGAYLVLKVQILFGLFFCKTCQLCLFRQRTHPVGFSMHINPPNGASFGMLGRLGHSQHALLVPLPAENRPIFFETFIHKCEKIH